MRASATSSSIQVAAAAALVFVIGAAGAIGGGLAMAPLVAIAAIVVASPRAMRELYDVQRTAFWVAGALIVWLAATLAWTPTPGAVERFLRTIATSIAAIALVASFRIKPNVTGRHLSAWGVAALALLVTIETTFSFPLNAWGRMGQPDWILARSASKGVAILALSMWGASLCLDSRAVGSTVVVVILGAVAISAGIACDMTAAPAAIALGTCVWLVGYAWPRTTLKTVGLITCVLIAAAPILAGGIAASDSANSALPYSWAQRLDVWRSAASHIADAPVFGHGFDASRSFAQPEIAGGVAREAIPLHPHNLGLQLWLEGGGIAALLATVLVALMTWRTANVCSVAAARAYAALLACWTVFSMLSFGAWQEWWIASFGAAISLVALARPRDPQARALDA